MNFNGAENRPHGFPVWSGATISPQIGHWSIGESNKVRPVSPGGSRPGNSTARHRVSLTVTSQSMRLPPLNIRALPGALAIVRCRGHIRARCRRISGKPCKKTSRMNWIPAALPEWTGFQCGLLPAASGSFARNDRNGGVAVVGLCLNNCSGEAGTAGIFLT